MITRWQAARGYPKSGYLNKLQHKALLTEIVRQRPRQASQAMMTKSRHRVAAPAVAAAVGVAAAVMAVAAVGPQRGSGGGDPAMRPLHGRRRRRHAALMSLHNNEQRKARARCRAFFWAVLVRRRPRLFPRGLAQRVVDALLPAGTALLEIFQHILVDAQGHLFLDAGHAFCFGGASATLAVAFLNAASASLRASFRVRGRLGWSAIV